MANTRGKKEAAAVASCEEQRADCGEGPPDPDTAAAGRPGGW